MPDNESRIDPYLFQLVLSLQVAAMQQMGKIMNPVSGKIERNLEHAKASIDMIGMLADKTKGNLSDEEDKFINNILHELRLNYIDESAKPEPKPEEEKKEEAAGTESKTDTPEEKSGEDSAESAEKVQDSEDDSTK